MSSPTTSRKQMIESLADKEYRDLVVEESINEGLAFQIRATRNARGWTQTELGERAGKAQPQVSELEDPDHGRYTLRTLREIASALDVALVVRLVPFSQLVDYSTNLSPHDLAVAPFAEDPGLSAYAADHSESAVVRRIADDDPPDSYPR